MEKYTAIKNRAAKYTKILQQVMDFRDAWSKSLKDFILKTTKEILEQTNISASVDVEERFENLESITISLGKKISGIKENLDEDTQRSIIKENGSLMYSQLFNGKIQAWMTYPLIEGLMQPKQPKMLGIYAPSEFDENLILHDFDTFFKELILWENYDDDNPSQAKAKIGFGLPSNTLENS